MTHNPTFEESKTRWRLGTPKASTVQQAREEWAPHLAHWGKAVAENVWNITSRDFGARRTGWIDDPAF